MDAYSDSDGSGSYNSDGSNDQDFFLESENAGELSSVPPACRYTVIDASDLEKEQENALTQVMGIMACSTAAARSLLIHFCWNTERLFGELADVGAERLFKKAGVAWPASQPDPSVATKGDDMTCGTCFADVKPDECTVMDCGHGFCNSCWQQHIRIQILDGKSRRLRCMAFQCGTVCDEDKVKGLIEGDPDVLGRYERCLLESYVEDNATVQWCPSVPHCGRAIRIEGEQFCEPQCSCGTQFCFACSAKPHSPCTCQMWKLWREKCKDDSETKNWMQANTKPCPKCSKPVEKNGGCNLVICLCGQSFCWLCGEGTGREHTWTQISNHSCGRYKEELDRKIDEAQRNVKRYNHYHSRWEGHMDSGMWERNLRAKLLESTDCLDKKNTTQLKDYTWLTQGLMQICKARQILGYSYVFAYFMFGNDMFRGEITVEQNKLNQDLFEDQQVQLESEVERLSGLLGTEVSKIEEAGEQIRSYVINSTVNVDKRLQKLYELIENDLLGRISDQVVYISPYKGQSMLRAVAAAGTPERQAVSGLVQPEVIDLTTDPPSPPRQPSTRPRHAPDPFKRRRY
eukprot:jgi/Botrbrau1/13794/Bobra.0056s0044.1